MKISALIIWAVITASNLPTCLAQNRILNDLCTKLKSSMLEDPFNLDRIKFNLELYEYKLKNSTISEYESCNCADSLWAIQYTRKYQIEQEPDSNILSSIRFLNSVPGDIDRMNLRNELRLYEPKSIIDSLDLVLKRLKNKHTKEKHIYNLIGAEIEFLTSNKYTLKENYFQIIDNQKTDESITDNILLALYNSDNCISNRVKARIGQEQHRNHFYRMFGIITTSSSCKFPINHIHILKNINYKIEEEKVNFIIESLYKNKSNSLRKIKKKHQNRILKALNNPYLENHKSVIKLKNDLNKD